MRATLRFAVVLVIIGEALCHGQTIQPRIINGTPTTAFPSVGIVASVDYPTGFCSGTLISPIHVLTAAHCALEMRRPTSGLFILEEDVYATTAVFVHPEFDAVTLDNDIAILKLSEPVLNVEPSPIFRDVPVVGDELILVGFGAAGNGETGSDGTFGVKEFGITPIDGVLDTLIVWEFTSDSESNTAPGDSGGPGFIEIDGVFYVAGITSGGVNPVAAIPDTSFDTRVDAYQQWIDAIVQSGMNEEPPDDEPDCPHPGLGIHHPGFHKPGHKGPAFKFPVHGSGVHKKPDHRPSSAQTDHKSSTIFHSDRRPGPALLPWRSSLPLPNSKFAGRRE